MIVIYVYGLLILKLGRETHWELLVLLAWVWRIDAA